MAAVAWASFADTLHNSADRDENLIYYPEGIKTVHRWALRLLDISPHTGVLLCGFPTCRRRTGNLSCSGFLMSSWDGFTAFPSQLGTTFNLGGDQNSQACNHSHEPLMQSNLETNPAAHTAPRNWSAGTFSWLHHTKLRWPELYDEPSGPLQVSCKICRCAT